LKILLAKRRALGDTVLMSSTVELLMREFPEAEISALVPAPFAPVLEGNPRVRRVFTYESGWRKLVPALRRERFDHFIQLHASPRTRWLARFAGARETHFSVQNNRTEKAYGKHPNALEWDGFFLRTVFGSELPLPAPTPQIPLSEAEHLQGKAFWQRWAVPGEKVVFLGLGASRPAKRWPPSHFARFAELLHERCELVPALIVGPGEAEERFGGEVVDQLRAKGLRPRSGEKGDFIHAAGLSVRELVAAIAECRAYVGNDSGPKHIAVATGIPTLTFFGPEDPVEWHPYDRVQHPVLFLPGLACRREDEGRWCGVPVCELAGRDRHRCMIDLDPVDALEAFRRIARA
jgi:ADP-heptose:LPS heptosyltransferase